MFYIIVYRVNGLVEFELFKNIIILDMEKIEDKLNNSWFFGIINVFVDKNLFVLLKVEKFDLFFDCVIILIFNQVKIILVLIINEKVNYIFFCIKFFYYQKKFKRKFLVVN